MPGGSRADRAAATGYRHARDLREHPRIKRFRDFLRGWYLSYFHPDAARGLPSAGPQRHLNIHGDNIGNVVQFMEREHRRSIQTILKRIASKIPGIAGIDTLETQDKRVLLRFNDGAFEDPFLRAADVGWDPEDLCVPPLAGGPGPAARSSVSRSRRTGCITSSWRRSPKSFAPMRRARKGLHRSSLRPTSPTSSTPWRLRRSGFSRKAGDGFSHIQRASDLEDVRNLVAEGSPLGGLWYSDYLDAR